MPSPAFQRLNDGWNAEPNAPAPVAAECGHAVTLTFFLNPFAYEAEEEEERGRLTFPRCARWRLGSTNDEGWRAGQCRYSRAAPAWGEFYELTGDGDLCPVPTDWRGLRQPRGPLRHFLFYLRDETFECFAEGWRFGRGLPPLTA